MMLVASDGSQAAPQIELTWAREVTTPFVLPGVILGGVVLLIGLILLVMQLLVDREHRRSRAVAATAASAPTETTTSLAGDGDRPLTRREIRLAETQGRGGRPDKKPPATAVTEADGDEADEQTETLPAIVEEPLSDAPAPTVEPAATSDRAPTTEPAPTTGPASTSEAGELDAWVRSGAASPLPHEVDRSTPADLVAVDEPATPADPEPIDESRGVEPARAPWWRRRHASQQPEARADDVVVAAAEQSGPVEPGGDTDADAEPGSQTEQIPVVQPDEDTPQATGAFWRQAWGLGAQERADQEDER